MNNELINVLIEQVEFEKSRMISNERLFDYLQKREQTLNQTIERGNYEFHMTDDLFEELDSLASRMIEVVYEINESKKTIENLMKEIEVSKQNGVIELNEFGDEFIIKKKSKFKLVTVEQHDGFKKVDIAFNERDFEDMKRALGIHDEMKIVEFDDEEELMKEYIKTKNECEAENIALHEIFAEMIKTQNLEVM